MRISRRNLLQLSGASLALNTLQAFGQSMWPIDKPITIVVGYPPGQSADTNARQYARILAKKFDQSVIVINMPGANGVLAAQEVKRSKPDGYTLLWGGSGPLAINPSLYRNLSYNPLEDFAPACLTTEGPLFLIANLSLPCNTVHDLIGYAKSQSTALDYGTAGVGSTAHLAMSLLALKIGIQFRHIPYKGSPTALNNLVGGLIPLMIEASTSALPYIKSGRVKALGVTSKRRSNELPNVPTIIEQGVEDFEALAWNGIVAPTGTPERIFNAISEAIRAGIDNPATLQTLRAAGTSVAWMGPEKFKAFIASEVRKWSDVAKSSGAQID